MTHTAAPKFWASFAEALQVSAQERGFFAYVPWFLILVVSVSCGSAWFFHWYFPEKTVTTQDVISTLAAMMVVGGFLGAVSIACMAQIYGTLSDPNFSSYLQEEKIFDQFLFWPQFNLLVQITFVFVTALEICVAVSSSDDAVRLYMLASGIGLMLYVTTKTWRLVDLMRLLLWHKQDYARILQEILEEEQARAAH